MNKLKVGYFADGPWSHTSFELIKEKVDIKFICVRYDSSDDVLKEICEVHDIPYLKHSNINSPEFLQLLATFNCDLFISMSFNQIFKRDILTLPDLGVINCHAGKLPFYRGRNILNWALINDEKEFGITVHFVDEGIDTGDIIVQNTYGITDEDDYNSLLNKAYEGCALTLVEAVDCFYNNSFEDLRRIKQEDIHPIGMYCSARKVGDEVLNWNQSSRDVFNFVRSISNPGPNARTFLNGEEIQVIKVREVEQAVSYKGIAGAVVGVTNHSVYVKTNDSIVEVLEYSYSKKLKIGDRLGI